MAPEISRKFCHANESTLIDWQIGNVVPSTHWVLCNNPNLQIEAYRFAGFMWWTWKFQRKTSFLVLPGYSEFSVTPKEDCWISLYYENPNTDPNGDF